MGEVVLEGKKIATAGALKSYQFENVDIPRLGQYNIVLDSKNQPLCIIRTTKVEIIPFLEVSSEQAYKEGENDRTLESWRNGYKRFLINEFREYNIEFSEDIEFSCFL
ncbi:TPA: ASCH domain-containing protein [Streptococcus suis]